jgi:hypothetical protein
LGLLEALTSFAYPYADVVSALAAQCALGILVWSLRDVTFTTAIISYGWWRKLRKYLSELVLVC